MITRLLAPKLKQAGKSILLLGPRQVGKSTLIQTLEPDLTINLADEEVFLQFQIDPGLLRRRTEALSSRARIRTVFVDEVQRIPQITNTVQALLDRDKSLKFYLSGSSARKLKRGGANLLPGRILSFKLGPVTASELNYILNDELLLKYGSLPEIVTLKDQHVREKLLSTYAATYVKEEIQAEALVRSLPGFLRFLDVAAQSSGNYVDLSKMAKWARIPRQSAARHFEILEDTLIAYRLEKDPGLEEESLVKHPRFYFFDVGVLNALQGSFALSSDRVGRLFEHLFVSQLFASFFARAIDPQVYNFRTRGGLEVDFIIKIRGKVFAVEVKASRTVSDPDIAPLRQIERYYGKRIERFVAYRGSEEQKDGKIWILPWTKVLREMGL